MHKKKATEPQKLETPLYGTEKSQLETIDEISFDQSQFDKSYEDYLDTVAALEKRADNPTFPMADRSPELIAVRNEVSRLARTGELYFITAYFKYLSALGFGDEDAKTLADNLEGPCRSNIYEKVQRARGTLEVKTVLFM